MSFSSSPAPFSDQELSIILACANKAVASPKLHALICRIFGKAKDNRTEAVNHWFAERGADFAKATSLRTYTIQGILRKITSGEEQYGELTTFLKIDIRYCLIDTLRKQQPHITTLKGVIERSVKNNPERFSRFGKQWGLSHWIDPQQCDDQLDAYAQNSQIHKKGCVLCPKAKNIPQDDVCEFVEEVFLLVNKTLSILQLVHLLSVICPAFLEVMPSTQNVFIDGEIPFEQEEPLDNDSMEDAAREIIEKLSDDQIKALLSYWRKSNYRGAEDFIEQITKKKQSRSAIHNNINITGKVFRDIIERYAFDENEHESLLRFVLLLSLRRFPEFRELEPP